MNCSSAGCANGPDGGTFAGQTSVSLWTTRCRNHDEFLPLANCAADSIYIRYTTDGTKPTSASSRYDGPIKIDSTTTVTAAVELNGTLLGLVHAAVFTREAEESDAEAEGAKAAAG